MVELYSEDEYLFRTGKITPKQYIHRIRMKKDIIQPKITKNNSGLNAEIFRYIARNSYDYQYKKGLIPPSENWYMSPESDGYTLIFVNDVDKQVIMGIRGTGGGENRGDIIYNMYADFNFYTSSDINNWRYKDAKNKLNKIFIDYPDYKINLVGHSLGGSVAQTLNREYEDKLNLVVMYGRPVDYYNYRPNNSIDIISNNDSISKGQYGINGGYVIQDTQYYYTPFTAHKKLIEPNSYIDYELNKILQK